jgi:Flp pilus assembly protein TadG
MKATTKHWSFHKKESGQSIVELTLITPLLLIALYIPADFGIAFLTAHLAQNAVREGARIGSGLASGDSSSPVKDTQATLIKDAVFARLPQRLSQPSVNIKFYFTSEAATCMQAVEVTTTGNYAYGWFHLLRLVGIDVPPSMPITKTTQMRYNYQRSENSSPICAATGFNQTYSS